MQCPFLRTEELDLVLPCAAMAGHFSIEKQLQVATRANTCLNNRKVMKEALDLNKPGTSRGSAIAYSYTFMHVHQNLNLPPFHNHLELQRMVGSS